MVRPVPEITRDPSVTAALESLAAGDGSRAESVCRERLAQAPDSVDHLRLLGRALVAQSRLDEAERVLRRVLELQPELAPAYEDLGGILAMQRRFEEAVASLQTALRLDPGLPLADKKLGQALAALGRGSEADAALENWFGRTQDRANVAVALDHLRAGRKDDAVATLKARLRINPDNVDAMLTLAQAWWGDEKRLSDIEALLRRVTTLAPGHAEAWSLLGDLFIGGERAEEAIGCFRSATSIEPENARAWSGLGQAYARVGEMEKSASAYARSVQLQPDLAGLRMSHAHMLKYLGRQADSLREYRAAVALKPDFGEAYWSMANLKVLRFEPEEVAAMERQLAGGKLSESADVHMRFALGKAHEDAGDYDRAWEFYHGANLRHRPTVAYDPVSFELRQKRILAVFSRAFMAERVGQGYQSAAPIFIVGLPRSGSTLIEQILASHSEVEGTLELPVLGAVAASTGRYRGENRDFPESVRELRALDLRSYGQQYIEQTRIYRTTDKPRFTDKLPNNFAYVGFAHLILPNATFINARRHPLDSCLGNYKQLFGKGQNFTYDMNELGLYYRQYHETMKHWHDVLPGRVLDVHYEDTVLDFDAQVRRILDHCGLPFEEACLRFHETRRPVQTASSEQVRQPLHTRALGNWRRYAKHLGPWQEELADILAELPDAVRNAGL